ncbi:hypothetical protein RB25_11640 [Herbaspirillum rubrisubalbicans]|uniref:hypothetical protein n=1 Tax=Herbaspirillum rubrisubalbicans TaxID=80842 RepID=UPI000DC56E79|nr:hypothetical protein [Herbaspirillum rubrisubalbicans]RAN48430.1 hypothetical protein RB25_11640 [Herbaspirillum rubrisubalbicans]
MSEVKSSVLYSTVEVTNDGSESHRAALLLHALHQDDREWLLMQLPQEQRGSLLALLKELAQLGIPRDPDLLRELPPAAPRQSHPVEVASESESISLLSLVDGQLMANFLREEPAQLIGQLLLLHPWPWYGTVLEGLDVFKRRQVENHLSSLRCNDVQSDLPDRIISRLPRQRLLAALSKRLDLLHPRWRDAHVELASVHTGKETPVRRRSWFSYLTGKGVFSSSAWNRP